MIIDFHTHLSDDFEEVDELLQIISTKSIEECEKALKFREVRVTFGIHPWSADVFCEKKVKPILGNVDIIGEIGLCGAWTEIPISVQEKAFRFCLEIAQRERKPVVLHTKDAETRVLEILSEYDLPKVIVHWLANDDFVEEYKKIDAYFTVAPDFKQRENFIKAIPLERLLIESDGIEALKWAGHDVKTKSDVKKILEEMMNFIAKVKNISFYELEKQIEENVRRIYEP